MKRYATYFFIIDFALRAGIGIGYCIAELRRPNLHMEPIATFSTGESIWLHQQVYDRPDVHHQDMAEWGSKDVILTPKSVISIRRYDRKSNP